MSTLERIATKRRVVICGAGIAGLTAAYELTAPKFNGAYDVTVYQLGWRPGGKLASGRDNRGRNIEHGLHIWFGFYENAFRLLREVYDEWQYPRGQRITKAEDAIRAQNFTPIGNDAKGAPGWIDICFPGNSGKPGAGDVDLSLPTCLTNCLHLLLRFYDRTLSANSRLQLAEPAIPIDRATARMLTRNRRPLRGTAPSEKMTARQYLQVAIESLAEFDEQRAWLEPGDIGFVPKVLKQVSTAINNAGFAAVPDGALLAQILELAAAFLAGIFVDIVLEQREISEIDGMDFRDWLVRHGAGRGIVKQNRFVRALYDTMFQYPDGEIAKASYGAGTASQVVLRMLGTYRGALAWELEAGAGEVLMAPLFEVLRARDVKFHFFHKLTDVGISPDGVSVDSLRFDRQVWLKDPTIDFEPPELRFGLMGWGATPNWARIKDGETLEARKVDLESHWCNEKVCTVQIDRSVDFDDVVLAVPLGVLKDFGSGESPCRELIKSNEQFKSMTEKLQLVPSISVQLWTSIGLPDLGWTAPKPALVSGPEPLDIWADMSHLRVGEVYASGASPASLQYLCDVLPSTLYNTPSTQLGVKDQAQAQALSCAADWLTSKASVFWPQAYRRGQFDWDVLYAPGLKGKERLSVQVVRANINPSDCCVATSAASTAWRLKTDGTDIKHLYLAGAWIDTGFNTECVEAAAMSGMQAARAITGEDKVIPGETFLHPSLQHLGLCEFLQDFVFSCASNMD